MTNSTRCTLLAKQACTTFSHVVQKITPPSANNFLKHFFTLFAALTLGIGNAWAEKVTLWDNENPYVASDSENTSSDGVVKWKNSKTNTYSAPTRIYKDDILTITSSNTIVKVEFVCAASNTNNYGPGHFSSDVGTYSYSGALGTWTGEANSIQFTASGGQVRIHSVTVTYESATPAQKYTLTYQAGSVTGSLEVEEGANLLDALKDITPEACDPTSKDPIGWSESEIKTKQADAPTLLTDADVMPSEAHSVYYVFAKKETTGGGEATEKTGTYTFSSYAAGTQYAKNEEHKLDDDVTIYTNDCHFTDELRIYSSNTNNGYVVSNELPGKIVSMDFNAGNKVDILVVSGSTDGSTWKQVGEVSVTSTSYKDYTLSFGETNYTYFKLDVKGANQVRLKKMSVTYMSGGGTTTISDYITSCGSAPDVIVRTLKSIAVTGMKQEFVEGDEFTFDGTCTATYSVTKNDVAQEDEKAEVTPTEVSSPDMTTAGEKEVTVTYTENEITKTTTYNITVNAKPTYTIKWHTAKGVTTDVTLDEGAAITKPATDPTMTGYEFMGWTKDCSVASDGSDFTALTDFGTADSDKDFYAVFAKANTTGGTEEKEFTFNITKADFNTTSYAANNNEKTSTATASDASTMEVKWTSNQVMQQSGVMQWQKNTGYIFNSTDLGTIKSVEITKTDGTFTTYYGTSQQPSSGTTVGNGYFQIKIGNATGKSSNIKVTFTQTVEGGSTTTYSNYITTCASGIEYVELGDDFKWSATEAEVTIDATDNEFPTLTNTHNVPVKYSSSDDAIATIAADGTVTLKKEGTVTITAKYEGGISAGTGKEYKAKTVTYSLKVNKAIAQPTGTMYVKVTDAVTDGEYLIVYETGKVAFNGALDELDVANNTLEVEINSNTIAGDQYIDKAIFTIDVTNGTILSASGKYIGKTANSNGLDVKTTAMTNTFAIDANGNAIITGNTAALRYNKTADQQRFRYYKDGGGSQEKIQLYKKVDPNAVVEPVFTPVAGEYYGTQNVTISCATAGAEVYYTLEGTDPTSTSTKYTDAISIASTTTIKAVAIKGENSSAVVSATYTILAPLTTMQAIFDKATAVGETATPVLVTMNNWVVTGVKNSNAYVTDGTKGLIIYTASHGFNVGDMLSGTVACKVQLYKGSAELTELTATTEGLTVTTGDAVSPREVTDITTLGGVNTGSVIKVTGPCTINGTKYYVAGLELYNSLFAYTNPEAGFNYECTGVYVQFDATKQILPRKAEDLVKIETQQPAGIAFTVTELTAEVGATEFAEPTLTNPNSLTVTYKTSDETLATVNATTGEVTIGNKEGMVTITASFAGSDDYVAANASYNITITDPSVSSVTFDAAVDIPTEGLILTKDGISMEFTAGTMNNGEEYRCNASNTMTISYTDGFITKVVLNCLANGTTKYGPGCFTTTIGSYSYEEKVGTWTGEAKSVVFTSGQQVRMTTVTVYYKQDKRANSELAWSEETVNLTVGEIFTAPTFSNPNGLDLTDITFTSDNTALATVNNAGAISLVSGKTGTATITATFAGDATYKAAEVTCVITVSPKSEKVVILAQYGDQWYALKAAYLSGKTDRLDAIPVHYVGGKLYNVAEADKASIEWSSVVESDKVSFINDGKYLKGKTTTTLLFEEDADGLYQWDNTTYTMTIGTTVRSFLYNGEAFRNFAVSNAGKVVDDILYSSLPVVTAPVYATGTITPMENLTPQMYGTICLENNVVGYEGITFYKVAGKEDNKVIFDEVTELVAGMPYIYIADSETATIVKGNEIAAEAGYHNSLQGTFTQIDPAESNILTDNYILYNNVIKMCGKNCGLKDHKAYFIASELDRLSAPPAQMPGRRRVSLNTTGENAATGIGDVVVPTEQATKVIINGQLIIIRDGEKFNVQGQRL